MHVPDLASWDSFMHVCSGATSAAEELALTSGRHLGRRIIVLVFCLSSSPAAEKYLAPAVARVPEAVGQFVST